MLIIPESLEKPLLREADFLQEEGWQSCAEGPWHCGSVYTEWVPRHIHKGAPRAVVSHIPSAAYLPTSRQGCLGRARSPREVPLEALLKDL